MAACVTSSASAASAAKKPFDLAAGAADKALKQLSIQAGVEVIYSSKLTRKVTTNKVRGDFTAKEAMDLMLAGTGLVGAQDEGSGSLTIRKETPDEAKSASEAAQTAPGGHARESPKKKATPTPRNQEPMKKNKLLTALTGTFVLLLAPADAQTVAAANDATDQRQEKAIELSPFVVDSTRDVGYLASNTLAGSRLNTSLKDTPASISVFTAEFLSDIGAFDISEALRYAVNVEYQLDDDRAATPNGNETVSGYQNYRIRGLKASIAQNYFRWSLPKEMAVLERIEDSRGPNSVLFGVASPGGLINSMTKRALGGRAFQKASFTVMSYDSYRGTIDLNRPLLDGKLAFRLNTVYNKTNTFRHWQYQESKIAHLAGKYSFSDRTQIRAEFQRGQIDSNQPRGDNLLNNVVLWHHSGRPTFATQTANAALGISRLSTSVAQPRVTYISNNDMTMAMRGTLRTTATGSSGVAADGPIYDPSLSDPSINIGGPAQDRSSRFDSFSAFLEHQFSKTTFLEIGYNHQGHVFDRYDPQVDTPQRLRGDPNQRLNDGTPNPFAGQLYLEGGWQRHLSNEISDTGRVMFSTELDAKKWGNYRIAALTEYEKSFFGSSSYREMWVDAVTGLAAFNATPENTENVAYRRSYPVEGDWASYHLSGPGRGGLLNNVYDPITGRTLSSAWIPSNNATPREVYTTQKAYMLAGQARYFNGRLILAGGLRRDDVDEYSQGRMRDPMTNVWIAARNPLDAQAQAMWANNVGRNKTLGLVYHATPWLSLNYNQADNISLPNRGQRRLPDNGVPGEPIPLEPPKGKGQDAGLALELFKGRINARATYYTTKGVHQATTSPAPVRAANTRIMDALFNYGLISEAENNLRKAVGGQGLFDHKSEGVELQVTANMTRNWRFQANYSFIDAVAENLFPEWRAWHVQNVQFLSQINTTGVVSSAERTIQEEIDFYLTTKDGLDEYTENDGGTKLGTRRHKMSFFTRYTFSSGWLKGAYVGGGYNYQSKLFTGLDPDGNEAWAPAYGRFDVVAGYTVRGLRKDRQLSFQLNVLNVFNDHDPVIVRYNWSTGQRLIFRSRPQSPMTWRFTTNFEF